jgi:hypothetical protein
MTKSRPILFSAPMVRAILDGTKTQTRRVVKPQPIPWRATECDGAYEWRYSRTSAAVFGSIDGICTHCPYGAPGDTLWVRETWRGDPVEYRADTHSHGPADGSRDAESVNWRPSIFMPRWASRLTLRITEVRVERLQEISEDDARAEGAGLLPCTYVGRCQSNSCPRHGRLDRYRLAYRALWDSINGKAHPWESNCWVWVLSFEVMR